MGARPERPLQRRAALVPALTASRHAGCAEVLPPRRDRAVSRASCRVPRVVPPGARAEPALLSALVAARTEAVGVKRIAVLVVVLAALIAPSVAVAHPLGNFTVNRFSRVEVSGPRIYVVYVLDLAEIPTFQAGKIDPGAYARRIAHGAELTVNGRRALLVPGATALAHPPGAGGLRTTRLEVVLRGPLLAGPADARYRDTNYSDRIGWKEI